MKKDTHILFRTSSSLKERIKEQAKKFNKGNISSYIEEALLYCLEEDERKNKNDHTV